MGATLLLFVLTAAPLEEGTGASRKDDEATKERTGKTLPVPKFSRPEGQAAYEKGIELFLREDFSGARSRFRACRSLAATREDEKLVGSMVDDCAAGAELLKARAYMKKKNLKGALTRARKALVKFPETRLRPKFEEVISECEKILYFIIEDFESEWTGPSVTVDDPDGSTRRVPLQVINDDPRYVRRGKQSLRWDTKHKELVDREGGVITRRYRNDVATKELPPVFDRYRYLKLSIHCGQGVGSQLRICLAPAGHQTVYDCRYTIISLQNKTGWFDVSLDLRARTWSNTKVALSDVKYVILQSLGVAGRDLYIDFVHLE